MINMGRIILNLLVFPFAIIGGYFVSCNPFKIQNRIANRFYPGHLTGLRVFFGIIFISIYLGTLDYFVMEYIVLMGYDRMEIKEIQFIVFYLYSIIPIAFPAFFFKLKYGKIKVLIDTPKPTAEELRNEIFNNSNETMTRKDKLILISLCKYYTKVYGKENDVEKISIRLKNDL
jgi:hypothetical protein